MVEIAWRGAGCVAALLATTAVRAQTVETFDGSTAASFACPAGITTTFGVFGTPNAPFATLASPVQIEVATPYGTLRAAPGVDGAALAYDGFDPTHPLYNASRLGPTGAFAQAVQPFQYGADYFAAYAVQTIAADPASPFGFSLSNAVQLAFVPPQPEVYDVSPNLALPGQLVVVSGSHFVADVNGQTVTVGGAPCVVVASSHDEITAIVPAGATSGHVVVTHAGGNSAPADALGPWLAVTPGAPVAPAGVGAASPASPASLQTVVGNLGAGQVAAFPLHLEPGQQVSAELYPWNPLTERIEFAPPTPTTPVADPILKVQIFPASPLTVATDDNAGPATCAAFGPASTGVHFVADQPMDLMIEVSYKHPQSAGWFALVFGAVSAAGLPVTLQRLDPEFVAPGGVLHVFGTSFDPEAPEGHAVLIGGVGIEPFEITPTRMSVIVPLDARSGPVGLLTPTAAVVPVWERTDAWLVVMPGPPLVEVEGTPMTVAAPCFVYGTLAAGADQDDYFVSLNAGQKLSIELYGCDFGAADVLNSWSYYAPIVDPEFRIMHASSTYPLYLWEWNAGPGVNAMNGNGSATSAFTAPATATYRIKISSAFWASWGEYAMVLNFDP